MAEKLDDETFLDDDSPPIASSERAIPWSFNNHALKVMGDRSYTEEDGTKTLRDLGLKRAAMTLVRL